MGCLNSLPFAAGTFCRVCGLALRLVKKGVPNVSSEPNLFACCNNDCKFNGIVIVDEFEVS